MKKNLLLLFISLCSFNQLFAQASSTYYNDGRIRLRIWAYKVWADADCSEVTGSDPTFKNIQVRVPSPGGGYDYSPAGFSVYLQDVGTHRFWDMSQLTAVQIPSGVTLQNTATQGYLLFDQTYNGQQVPNIFEWRVGEMWEKDACGGNFDYWTFNANPFSSSFCLDGDDAYVSLSSFSNIVNQFRGYPAGTIGYIQTDAIDNPSNTTRDDRYSMLFAFQWDWVDALPPTCASPKYSDGPIQLDVQLQGLWSDSDYDGGAFCLGGFAGNEELRFKYQVKDNLTASYPAQQIVTPGALDISQPGWANLGGSPQTLFSKTYTTSDVNMESVDVNMELWEEDGCGSDTNFDTGCFNNDEDHYTGAKNINWRDSPPNAWNYMDIPLRNGTSRMQNYTAWVRYKWTIANPTVSLNAPYDRTLCLGTATTITSTTTNATYYQWQVTTVTGPSGSSCPVGATWTDIAGANCKDFTPPQTPGTRIYRLHVINRNGAGSKTNTGSRYAEAYSDCVRVTYFPYSPPVSSATVACGGAVLSGTTHTFSFPAVPAVDAVANATSYTWTISGPAIATISAVNGNPSTNITFPSTPGTYSIILTTNDACAAANATSVCSVVVTNPNCDYVYVSPTGSNLNNGSPDAPLATIENALTVACAENRKHIRLLTGTYNETNKLVLGCDGIIIDGGYTVSGIIWKKNAGQVATININSAEENDGTQAYYQGVFATSRNNFVLQDLIVNVKTGSTAGTVSGTYNNRGKTVYGARFISCNGYQLTRTTINTGNGTNGNTGTNGTTGSSGNNGTGGNNGSCDGSNGTGGGGAVGVGSGSRAGGAGGSGGSGGAEGNNSGASGASGSAGGGGAAGSSSVGGGGGGGSCHCCSSRAGSSGGSASAAGSAGAIGSPTYSAGSRPATPTLSLNLWTPAGQSATAGDGTGGGGGAGGGGGGGQGGTWCDNGGGNGGGGGGSGGQGGTGGTGGGGGGGSFGLFAYGAGTGTLTTSTINAGSAGTGGSGGTGGAGGSGGSGGSGAGNCTGEVGAGGSGSSGGAGGAGGRGQDGANGLAQSIVQLSSATVTSNAGTTPTATTLVTSTNAKGCTYSEVTLTKATSPTAGSWNLLDGGTLVNDITASTTSFATSQTNVNVYYTATGQKDVALLAPTAGTYDNLVNITTARTRPTIDIPTTACSGVSLSLDCTPNSPGTPVAYDWIIQESTSGITANNNPTPINTYNVKTPGTLTFTNTGASNKTYQIRLKVQDDCCGWSIPEYKTITVYPTLKNNTVTAPAVTEFCNTASPSQIVGSLPTGGTSSFTYEWQLSVNGGAFSAISGATSQNYTPASITSTGDYTFKRIVRSSDCTEIESNAVTLTVNPSLATNTAYSPATNTFCGLPADPLAIAGSDATGGNSTYSYQWYLDTGSGFNPISGATTRDYDPSAVSLGGTYIYKRLVNSGGCSDYSNTISLLFTPNINNNTISTIPSPLCAGADPANIVGSTPTGGTGSYSYQWKMDDGSGQVTVGGNATNYDPPILSVGNYTFTRTVVSGACLLYTSGISLQINPSLSANTLTAPAAVNFCNTGDAAIINGNAITGGNGTPTYSWSLNGSPLGVNTQNYDPPNLILPGDYVFTRSVSSGGCTGSTASVTVHLDNISGTNTLAAPSPISFCGSGNPTVIDGTTISGNNVAYQWTMNGTNIGTTEDYDPPLLSSTGTYTFSRSVTSGVCNLAAQTLTVTINPVPIAIISGNNSTCINTPVTLTGGIQAGSGIAGSFAWSSGTPSGAMNASTTVIPTVNPTTYTVTVTNTSGCTSTKYSDITVFPLPQLQNTASFACNSPTVSIGLLSGTASPYIYSVTSITPAGTIPVSNLTGVFTLPLGTTDASFSVSDGNNCISTTVNQSFGCPLPVNLIQFTAFAKDALNIVNWTTASELNSDYFAIERSVGNTTDFHETARLQAHGTTNTAHSYQYLDEHPLANVYYRLRIVDLDGSAGYSNIVQVQRKKGASNLTIYPNPTSDALHINYETEFAASSTLQLTDVLGRVLQLKHFDALKGLNELQISLSDLPSAVYYISIDNGVQKTVRAVVKE